MKKSQLSVIVMLTGIFLSVNLNAQKNKTKLVYKDGDRNKGIEKIIFENEQGAKVGEFDVQANNPYDAINASVNGRSTNGFKKYDLLRNQAAKLFNNNLDKVPEEKIIASSHAWVVNEENATVISYNLFGYTEEGHEVGLRKSSIMVLDERGQELYSKETEADSYGMKITPNSKYLGYGYGETTHDINPDDFGYKIIDIENGMELADIPISILNIAYTKYQYLILRGYKDTIFRTWVLDQESASLYELDGDFYVLPDKSFKEDGQQNIISNLTPYRIK